MAILSATEIGPRQTWRSVESGDGAKTRWRIISDERLNGWESVAQLPAIGAAWSGNSSIYLIEVRAEEAEQLDGGGWAWDVDLNYGVPQFDTGGGGSGGSYPSNPLLRPAVWSFDGQLVQYFPTEDTAGNKLVNTAGDPLEPVEGFFKVHAIATIQKNLATFSMSDVVYWTNGINSASVQGVPKGYLRINNMNASQRSEGGLNYWAATVTIEYNPDSWELAILNQGMRYWENPGESTEKLMWATDADGNRATESVLLDEYGGLLIDPTAAKPATMPEPVMLYPKQHTYVNFNVLLGV